MVDIYSDPDVNDLQVSEYRRIADKSSTLFKYNNTKLLMYAKRRGVKEELEKIFNGQ